METERPQTLVLVFCLAILNPLYAVMLLILLGIVGVVV